MTAEELIEELQRALWSIDASLRPVMGYHGIGGERQKQAHGDCESAQLLIEKWRLGVGA